MVGVSSSSIATIADRALINAQANPLVNPPGIIAHRLGIPSFPDFAASAPAYRILDDGTICFAWVRGDERCTYDNMYLGLGAALLLGNGYPADPLHVFQMTGYLAWPWPSALPGALELHPFAGAIMLGKALRSRRWDQSGCFPVGMVGSL